MPDATPDSLPFEAAPAGRLDPSRQRLVLLAAIMGSFVASLDATVVNVALPAISSDLGGELAGQQWVSNAYLLTLGSLILIGGSLGDVFGERKIFALGVGGFGVASLVCALAPTIEWLIAARGLQGVAGALLTPSALAVIIGAFPPKQRGAAIGSWTAWSGMAGVVGPFVGGWLIDSASWRWIFAINVPFVIVTLVLVSIAVPARDLGVVRRRVDWLGATLCAIGLAGPVYALIRQPAVGWSSGQVLVPLVGGLLVFGLFLAHEARAKDPMLPLGLFARRNFAAGNIETLTLYGGLSLIFFVLVLFLQQVAGYSALEAGLATLPTTLVMFVASKQFGRLADRHGPRLFMGGGPLIGAVGIAWLLRMGTDVSYVVDLLPAMLIFSLGLAITVAPLSAAVLADADDSNAGIASATNNAVARVAGLVAIASLGAVITGSFVGAIDDGLRGRSLSSEAAAVVSDSKRQTFARADTSGLPQAEATAVASAVEDASLGAFHRGVAISVLLIGLGGIAGFVGIRNPRRSNEAEESPGGALVGAPLSAAGCSTSDNHAATVGSLAGDQSESAAEESR